MRHQKRGRKLNRSSSHRTALCKNLALSLIEHERIITTRAMAKYVQPFVERLITLAKDKTDHHQRLVFGRIQGAQRVRRSVPADRGKGTTLTSRFGAIKKGEHPERRDRRMIKKLFDHIGPLFRSRPGGYTRIIRLPMNRLGDNATRVIFELVQKTGLATSAAARKAENKQEAKA